VIDALEWMIEQTQKPFSRVYREAAFLLSNWGNAAIEDISHRGRNKKIGNHLMQDLRLCWLEAS